ncbi:hypothetical protein [uncultured Algibacter sp.]|uniref:hypothetical protein n=1 Tax=uncultured Algibacter sp. TaxID=298659 RepID=UPI002618B0EC|nr:hypothetical protein [uncultured Algibacter sp.]
MQKSIAILLFLVLSVRPAYYLGQVAYYQLNIDYIIENYCINTDKPELQCNGKCHLAKQIQIETNEGSQNGNLNTIAILECFYSIFNNPQDYSFTHDKLFLPQKTKDINNYMNTYSFLHDMTLFRPPII